MVPGKCIICAAKSLIFSGCFECTTVTTALRITVLLTLSVRPQPLVKAAINAAQEFVICEPVLLTNTKSVSCSCSEACLKYCFPKFTYPAKRRASSLFKESRCSMRGSSFVLLNHKAHIVFLWCSSPCQSSNIIFHTKIHLFLFLVCLLSNIVALNRHKDANLLLTESTSTSPFY